MSTVELRVGLAVVTPSGEGSVSKLNAAGFVRVLLDSGEHEWFATSDVRHADVPADG